MSKFFQRHDEDVASYCTRLRVLEAYSLKEDLNKAEADEVPCLKKNSTELMMNQFKIVPRRDLWEKVGILLLKGQDLTMDEDQQLVKLLH